MKVSEMAITLTALPSGITLISDPFQSSNGSPNNDRFPAMPSEFSSVASTINNVSESILKAQSRILSPGAIAGISIGVVVAVALIVGILIFIFRRQRRPRSADRFNSEEKAIVTDDTGTARERSENMRQENQIHATEINGETVHEVEVPAKNLHEADNMNIRAELDGGWKGSEALGSEQVRYQP
ncbi:hypothetical protein OPT61_g845 [Boeremia exigua]|uniref:Uncharacterized protein n=1 Tax=Boeremia exigua TaxID=749465 RepID=A0ACC2ISC5_9PLEO|nr:hypothetical protein OPT61_g845 [Boeremia exigua]